MDKTTSSLERIYPASEETGSEIAGNDTLQLHLERYHFAGDNCIAGYTADVACGAGYGSFLLAQEYIKEPFAITAIDSSKEAIQYAQQNYAHPRISFLETDALAYNAPTLFQNVISLETIEHLSDPAAFVQHWSLLLAKGGLFIASAPVTPSMDANPYHLQDFTTTSFKKLFTDAGLKEKKSMLQVQRYKPFQVFNRKQGRSKDLRSNLLSYYFRNPAKAWLRIRSVFKDGFCNKYLVVVFEK